MTEIRLCARDNIIPPIWRCFQSEKFWRPFWNR